MQVMVTRTRICSPCVRGRKPLFQSAVRTLCKVLRPCGEYE